MAGGQLIWWQTVLNFYKEKRHLCHSFRNMNTDPRLDWKGRQEGWRSLPTDPAGYRDARASLAARTLLSPSAEPWARGLLRAAGGGTHKVTAASSVQAPRSGDQVAGHKETKRHVVSWAVTPSPAAYAEPETLAGPSGLKHKDAGDRRPAIG